MSDLSGIKNKLGKVIYPIFMFYLIQLVVYYIIAFIVGDLNDMSLALQFFAGLAVIPYLIYLYKKDTVYMWIHRDSFFKKNNSKVLDYFLCVLFGIMMAVFLNNLFNLTGLTKAATGYVSVQQSFFLGDVFFELLALGIVTPLAEELMYRGVLFGYLNRFSKRMEAYLVSAILFGFVHMNLVQFLYAFIFGMFLCLFVEKLDTVLASILIHSAANVTSVASSEYGILTMTSNLFGNLCILICLAIASGFIIRYIILKAKKI
ncbi:MAG: CPBP family intramembrane metalloprotease [Lachnospiraceae bacterium]|nr:CPBP family intramembrane metalloprotease [Lachnospiraceae bacterium]